MNEHIIELVHGELDGTNSPEESASLAGIVAKDDQVRAYLDETRTLFGALDQVPDVEPPAGLRDRIMTSIEREASISSPQQAAQSGFVETVKRFFSPVLARPAWALSYAFTAGLLVGIATLTVFTAGTDTDPGVVQGTIGSPYARMLDNASLQAGDISAEVATVGLDNDVVLDVSISGTGEATVILKQSPDQAAGASVTVDAPAHFTISLNGDGDPTVILIAAGQEQSIQLQASR